MNVVDVSVCGNGLHCDVSCVSDTDKAKLCLDDTDLGIGGSGTGPSAALTPAIWEKTIPYDGENFHLEYMDLEEFLMENGIPTSMEEDAQKSSLEDGVKKESVKAVPCTKAPTPARVTTVSLLPIQELDKCGEEVVIIANSETEITCDVTTGEWRWEDQSAAGRQ